MNRKAQTWEGERPREPKYLGKWTELRAAHGVTCRAELSATAENCRAEALAKAEKLSTTQKLVRFRSVSVPIPPRGSR